MSWPTLPASDRMLAASATVRHLFLRRSLVHCQNLKLGLSVIPAQAGIQIAALDSPLRGNDEPENQELTRPWEAPLGLKRMMRRAAA